MKWPQEDGRLIKLEVSAKSQKTFDIQQLTVTQQQQNIQRSMFFNIGCYY